MEFRQDGDNMGSGGGNALLGLLAGSTLNKDRDDGRSMTWFAMVIVLIVFFIAIIFLALAFKDRNYEVRNNNNYGELLATMIAAKGMDNNNCKDSAIDKFEIMQKIEHSEDRARETQTQQEIGSVKSELGAVALMMQKTASDNEKDNLKEFGEIKQQLGIQSQALQQILTTQNNAAIINGVIQQLTMGKPCFA